MQIEDNHTIPRKILSKWVLVQERPKLVEALSRGLMRWNPGHRVEKAV